MNQFFPFLLNYFFFKLLTKVWALLILLLFDPVSWYTLFVKLSVIVIVEIDEKFLRRCQLFRILRFWRFRWLWLEFLHYFLGISRSPSCSLAWATIGQLNSNLWQFLISKLVTQLE